MLVFQGVYLRFSITKSKDGKFILNLLAYHISVLFTSEWIRVILLMEEILHQLVGSLSHYLHGFIHPRWWRTSSINSIAMSCVKKIAAGSFSSSIWLEAIKEGWNLSIPALPRD